MGSTQKHIIARACVGALLLAGLAIGADVPHPPAVNPADYPPGTIFSVTWAPDGRISWAASQDPELPPVALKDGTKLPILSYDLFEMPKAESGPFGVVRSGGHLTLAQLLYLQTLPPSQQLPYRRDEKMVTRDMLKGYVAVTVRFDKTRRGDWIPEIVSWKSLQLNVNNFREWLSAEPPVALKARIVTQLELDVNRRYTPAYCPLGLVK